MVKRVIDVLLVDDHDLVRAGIKRILNDTTGIKVIGEANNGEEAIRLVKKLVPHVVIMDLMMPGIGGLEATRKILRMNQDTKVMIVTASSDNMYPSRLLHAGAMGYLTKDISANEMVQAIRSVYAGQRYISSKIAQQLVLKQTGDVNKSPFDDLSSRELQVAVMVAKGYKVREISEKLSLSTKTVNSYRYRIFDKLGAKGDVDLAHTAIQYGLLET